LLGLGWSTWEEKSEKEGKWEMKGVRRKGEDKGNEPEDRIGHGKGEKERRKKEKKENRKKKRKRRKRKKIKKKKERKKERKEKKKREEKQRKRWKEAIAVVS
jgi:hypothetical protein